MRPESTLRTALASAFDHYTVRDRLRAGNRNVVYEVSVDGRRAVGKLTDTQPGMLAREGAVLDALARETTVPVPEVLATGDGYLVLEWAEGEVYDPADPRDRRRNRLRALGRSLARLHRATAGWFDGHGELERGDGQLAVDSPQAWSDRLWSFLDEWASDLAGTPDADVGRAILAFAEQYRDVFADRPTTLVHGEACPEHVLFDGEAVGTILDWEIAQAAPGPFDLAWAERDFLRTPFGGHVDDDLWRSLRRGYETELSFDPGSAFRCAVYRAAFAMRDLRLVNDTADDAGVDTAVRREAVRTYVFDRLDEAESTGIPREQ